MTADTEERCLVCRKLAHATETDDDNLHPECRRHLDEAAPMMLDALRHAYSDIVDMYNGTLDPEHDRVSATIARIEGSLPG